MPPLTSRRRSRALYEEDDDEQASVSASASASTSDSSKRQKVARNHDISGDDGGREEDEDDDDDDDDDVDQDHSENEDDSLPNPRSRKPQVNGRGRAQTNGTAKEGEYQPGAIVRVMVNNFVTYEHAEFLPGPNLNMVIGPNGTGKSSLVCAICLGLGYHPKHLGRAGSFAEFVKHGKDTAIIEVELQRRPNESANHIVRVRINREDNSRKWWLNDQETSHKEIQKLTRNLRIQIDNLCQFLPQDKVAEFAGLTPVQLLHETLRAAAPERIINQQSTLQVLHKDYRKVKEQVEVTTETLKGHENRQQGLQADVDRMRQREEIVKEIEELKKARVVAVYHDIRMRHAESKERRKHAERRLKELQIACGPALQAIKDKEAYRDKIIPVINHRKHALKDAERESTRMLRDIDAQDENVKEINDKIDAEINSFQTKKQNIGKIKRAITELEGKLKKKPAEFVAADWNLKIRQQEAILRENESEKRELEETLQQLQQQGKAKVAEVKEVKKAIEDLETAQGQKLAFLRRISPDAAKGWSWLEKNQGQFEKEVYGPPMMTCSVKDERYSDLLQALLQKDDFLCFVCQTRNDHKKLSNIFYGELKLSVTIRTCGTEFASFRPPLPVEQARQSGFDGYAIDYLEGPERVLAMLCAEKRLHASGVGLREISDAQLQQLTDGERISNWATGPTMYRITRRREYGAGAISTMTRKVMPGHFWKDQAPDDGEKARLQERDDALSAEVSQLRALHGETKQKLQGFAEGEDTVREEIDNLKHQKNELQRAATQYEALGPKIEDAKRDLERAQNDLNKARQTIVDLRAQSDQLVVEKARLTVQHKERLIQMRDAYQALLEAQTRHIEAASDVKGLETQNEDIQRRLEEERDGVARAKAEIEELRNQAREAQDKFQEAIASDPDSLPHLTELARGRTAEDIDGDIEAKNASLEVMHRVDPQVLRQFEKRARDIEQLTRHREELARKAEHLGSQIEELMRVWEPGVDDVVGRINEAFSHNFEQISCAGEVGIHKDEDFEQWAIEIKVKFRENETLQQLNQHRQSGGERAVSTIFYLMALQSMAQAPFRVVDEINQGMDPRNERMVHERMVEIACREHTSQYFLITPKLLTGLRYDPRMRVLCIASGEHVPPQGRRLDFRRLVRIQRAVAAGAVAVA